MTGTGPLDYLGLMEARGYPFRLVGAALRDADLFTARGWEPLKDKFAELSGQDAADAARALAEINRNLMLYAEKAVALYPLTAAEARRLMPVLASLHSKNAYAAAYPFVLSASSLATYQSGLKFAAIEQDAGLENVVLAGRVYRTERESMDVADLSTVPSDLQGFDQLIALRRAYHQVVHVAAVRQMTSEWLLEVRVDGTGHIAADELPKHLSGVRNWVEREYNKVHGTDFKSSNPINLFPSIAPLYSEKAGRVRQMGGTTTTASIKQERMRSKRDDLRQEKFHVAGQGAAQVTGYLIEKVWDSAAGSGNPSLVIPGRIATSASQSPFVRYCVVQGCATQPDYDLVFRKLSTALGL